MNPFLRVGRRKFLRDSALGLGMAPLVPGMAESSAAHSEPKPSAATANSHSLKMAAKFGSTDSVWIIREPQAGFQEQWASRELARGLRNLGLAREPVQAVAGGGELPASSMAFVLSSDRQDFRNPEAYTISNSNASSPGKASRIHITGATPQAVLYAVFDFLERQGAFFGLDGEVYPLDPSHALNLPPAGDVWRAQPRFSTRGLVPWPDFLNCVTVYNREDWRAYLEAMVRMRFNTLGVHVYANESFLSCEYNGSGYIAYTDTSATNRAKYLPERTSRYGMGSADFYDDEVFGSEATTQARNCWEAQEFAQRLWAEAFQYAKKLGIRTGVGFEPYQVPEEICRATAPEARYKSQDPKNPGPRIDPESVAAKDILETRLGCLLEAYPMVDYVWLWEDEGMSWASQSGKVPTPVLPFKQAYDFLKRHAPEKRLVVSGWGGMTRNFAEFHKALPEDIVFSSLNDMVGWDPVSEEYGKLEGRERWPIPWLEDDPAMWFPQFHVARFEQDMNLAEQYGCQGLLGIHWRHRIMNADAGYQSRNSWDKGLTATRFFQDFASVQTRAPRAPALAKILEDTDRDRLILCTFTGQVKNGHHEIHEFSGDYDEGFQFWARYELPESVKQSQAEVARQLRALTDAASSPAERERLNYLTRSIEFLTPYSESWSTAQLLNQKIQQADELKKQNKADEARTLVLTDGVPLWLKLAPQVREAFLNFQEIVSTRPDLGQLASMHNKYERLALYRLRASMKEFLGELPPEVERMFGESRQPDGNATARVFVPTRPTLLHSGERVRINAIVPGPVSVARVTLFTRAHDAQAWSASPMKLEQRRTFGGELHGRDASGVLMDYYVAAEVEKGGSRKTLTSPPEAPHRYHTVTLV
jgi:hypothetical protein